MSISGTAGLADLLPVQIDQCVTPQQHARWKTTRESMRLALGEIEYFFGGRPERVRRFTDMRRYHKERKLKERENLIAPRR